MHGRGAQRGRLGPSPPTGAFTARSSSGRVPSPCPGASRTDRFDFTLTSGPLTLTAVSNDLDSIFDISGGLVELLTAGDLLIGSLSFDSTAVSTTFAAAPGDYYYRVSGNVKGTAGSYLVSSAVVPAPGTSALLLVGLTAVTVGVRPRSAR